MTSFDGQPGTIKKKKKKHESLAQHYHQVVADVSGSQPWLEEMAHSLQGDATFGVGMGPQSKVSSTATCALRSKQHCHDLAFGKGQKQERGCIVRLVDMDNCGHVESVHESFYIYIGLPSSEALRLLQNGGEQSTTFHS